MTTVPTFRGLCGNTGIRTPPSAKFHSECTNRGMNSPLGCVTNHSGFTQKAQSPLTLWFHCLIFPIHPTSLLLFLKVFPKPTAMPEQTPKHSSFELCSSWVIPFHSQPWDSLIRLHSSTMTVFMGRERRAFSAN